MSNDYITWVDKEGNKIDPPRTTLETYYIGNNNKEKFRLSIDVDCVVKTSIKFELSKLNYFYVVDTNKHIIDGEKVSVCCAIQWKMVKDMEGFKAHTIGNVVNILLFKNIPNDENPEMAAILMLINHIIRTEHVGIDSQVGFVTDSDKAAHYFISSRKKPIYKQFYMPEGFKLIYASDRGSGFLNQIVRFCDKQYSKWMRNKKAEDSPQFKFEPCSFDNQVQFGTFDLSLKPYVTKYI